MQTLNEVYSSLSVRRRYEVWFVRFGLPDGAGAWWFRYLLTNPGRDGCSTAGTNLSTGVICSTTQRAMAPRRDSPIGLRSATSTAAVFAAMDAP